MTSRRSDHVVDSWTRYLDEVGRVPLLERCEVAALAHSIEVGAWRRAAASDSRRAGVRCRPKRAAELQVLVDEGQEAYRHLVSANLRLVVSIAVGANGTDFLSPTWSRRCGGTDASRGQVRPPTRLRLLDVCHLVDPAGDQPGGRRAVASGAAACARASAGRRLRARARPARDIPGTNPARPTLAGLSGVAPARVEALLRAATPAASLQQPVGGGSLGGALAADLPDPADAVSAAEARGFLDAALGHLPDLHRQAMKGLVGWPDGRPLSRRELAASMQLSREVVQRLETEALERRPRRAPSVYAGLVDGAVEVSGSDPAGRRALTQCGHARMETLARRARRRGVPAAHRSGRKGARGSRGRLGFVGGRERRGLAPAAGRRRVAAARLEQVDRASWDEGAERLVVVEVADFGRPQPRHQLALREPRRLLDLVRERVTASVLLTRHVPVPAAAG